MSEIEFIGKPSGDCECFCWDVDEQTFIEIEGKDSYKKEKEYKNKHEVWRIYQTTILNAMGFSLSENRKMRIKMIIEVIDED